MSKERMKEKIRKDGKDIYLSAQEYNLMTDKERALLRETLTEDGQDPDEYERQMKKLWPKKINLKVKWRNK